MYQQQSGWYKIKSALTLKLVILPGLAWQKPDKAFQGFNVRSDKLFFHSEAQAFEFSPGTIARGLLTW